MQVYLVDDDISVRVALRYLLKQQPDMQLIGEGENTLELLEHLDTLQLDVVLLDWELPRQESMEFLRQMRERTIRPRVLVMSSWPDVEQQALQAGADAFIGKSESPDSFLKTLRRLKEGDIPWRVK